MGNNHFVSLISILFLYEDLQEGKKKRKIDRGPYLGHKPKFQASQVSIRTVHTAIENWYSNGHCSLSLQIVSLAITLGQKEVPRGD